MSPTGALQALSMLGRLLHAYCCRRCPVRNVTYVSAWNFLLLLLFLLAVVLYSIASVSVCECVWVCVCVCEREKDRGSYGGWVGETIYHVNMHSSQRDTFYTHASEVHCMTVPSPSACFSTGHPQPVQGTGPGWAVPAGHRVLRC